MLRAYFMIALLLSTLAVALFFGIVHATSVPEFTVHYVDYSYDVPPTTTTTTNPYTDETITTTIPGRHVENKTIEVTINNNIGASYYNFRYKGRYTNEWNYYPSDPESRSGYNHYDAYSVPYQASNSSYTVASLPSFLFQSVPAGGEIDVQVQALFGNYRAVPYRHILPLPAPTYDFYFEGTTSDWSEKQTITFGESQTPTPSPSTTPALTPTITPYQEPQQTEQEIIIGVAIVAAVIGAGLVFLIYLIKRK